MKKALAFFASCVCLTIILAGCSKSEPSKGTISYDGYDTYVFFGVDSRAAGEDWKTDDSTGTSGAPSSDVVMLLTIDRDTSEAKIISVYRDTMLDVNGDGTDFEKCNTAYRESGVYGAIDMLEKNLDLQIDGYVAANFMTVADAIDILGGVDVDIEYEQAYRGPKGKESTVVDVANTYIKEMNRIYDLRTPYIENAGKQTLTGLQAVAYSRVRYTDGFDIRRTERQRNVVTLMAEKLKASDTETQHRVLKEMYSKVDTDLDESEMMSVFDLLVNYNLDDLKGFPFHTKMVTYDDKGTMYVPCDLKTNVAKLHATLYDNNNYEPNDTVLKYDKLISEETGLTSDDADQE